MESAGSWLAMGSLGANDIAQQDASVWKVKAPKLSCIVLITEAEWAHPDLSITGLLTGTDIPYILTASFSR